MHPIDFLISFALALIMFGIGASLKLEDFKNLFKNTKPLLIGLILQMLALPLFAFIIALCAPVEPAFKIGLFIVAICPGGTTSNFISYIVKAEVALSIALTCINSIIILFSIPLLSTLAINYFLGTSSPYTISIWSTFLQVLLILFIPATLGIAFNEKFGELAQKMEHPLRFLNTFLLAAVFAIKFFAGSENGGSGITLSEIKMLLPYCLLLHFGAMLGSYFLVLRMGLSNKQATTIGIEVGLQNTTLALLVSATLIGNNEMSKPALVFAIFSFFTTLAFALIVGRKNFEKLDYISK